MSATYLNLATKSLMFFFVVALTLKKKKHVSDYYLMGWFGVAALFFFSMFVPRQMEHLIRMSGGMLDGIFLLAYTKNITCNTRFERKDLLFFSPFLVQLALLFFAPQATETQAYWIAIYALYWSCVLGGIMLLHRYKKKVKNKVAPTQITDIGWLDLLVYGNLFFIINGTFLLVFSDFPTQEVVLVLNFIFMVMVAVKGILVRGVFVVEQPGADAEPSDSYASYGLKEPEQMAQKIKQVIECDRLYLNPGLTLQELAAAADTYPHYVTQALNTVYNQNFFDFVNQYRVQAAERLLVEPSNAQFTILSVAYECGFNSKSTFNRVFKEKMGCTPSQYKKTHNQ